MLAGTLLLGSLAQPVVGRVSDRGARHQPVVVGLCLTAVAALFAGLELIAQLTVVGLVLARGTWTAIRSCVLAAAVEITSGRESATLALAFTVLNGVGAFGALLAGLAGAAVLANAFVLAATLGFCAALAAILAGRAATPARV